MMGIPSFRIMPTFQKQARLGGLPPKVLLAYLSVLTRSCWIARSTGLAAGSDDPFGAKIDEEQHPRGRLVKFERPFYLTFGYCRIILVSPDKRQLTTGWRRY
jgi:hypothetical protein